MGRGPRSQPIEITSLSETDRRPGRATAKALVAPVVVMSTEEGAKPNGNLHSPRSIRKTTNRVKIRGSRTCASKLARLRSSQMRAPISDRQGGGDAELALEQTATSVVEYEIDDVAKSSAQLDTFLRQPSPRPFVAATRRARPARICIAWKAVSCKKSVSRRGTG